jgi:hypothetical protein
VLAVILNLLHAFFRTLLVSLPPCCSVRRCLQGPYSEPSLFTLLLPSVRRVEGSVGADWLDCQLTPSLYNAVSPHAVYGACCQLNVGFLPGVLFRFEDGGDMFIRNVG